uniref:Uncharacterized protein n=1 Tax=viral metagenome TaxID=1070528 RepID=A0A6M3XUL7_9ZZZZ
MKDLNKLQELSDRELEIHTENAAALLGDLKDHARLQAKYYRWSSKAQKNVDDLSLKLEIVAADIIQEIIEKSDKPIPASAKGELRKVDIFKDARYQLAKSRLNSAMEEMNYLQGLTRAFEGRGYRLKEVVTLVSRSLKEEELRVYGKDLEKAAEGLEFPSDFG